MFDPQYWAKRAMRYVGPHLLPGDVTTRIVGGLMDSLFAELRDSVIDVLADMPAPPGDIAPLPPALDLFGPLPALPPLAPPGESR